MKNIACIEDLRQVARRRVPKAFWDYVEAGSYTEGTLRRNREDLLDVKLRQRILIDVDKRDTSTTMLGEKVSVPVALAPIGICGMVHGDGEILACRAAQAAGIPFTLSTMSICSIEDVAQAVDKPFWFQVYVIRDRGFMKSLIERAYAAKCSALVLTVDLQILGQRHCDIRNGMTVPPEMRLANVMDIARKPAWAWNILKGKRKTFGNLAGHVKGMENITSLAQWTAQQFDPTLNWRDIEWVKSIWPGKLILKGIMDVEDARIAAQSGADAIVCSNHGGRQLDGAAVVDLDAAEAGGRGRRRRRGAVRRRHPHRHGRRARHRARRQRLPDRPLVRVRPRRLRAGRRHQGDRDHQERARRHDGADRRRQYRADRPQRAARSAIRAEEAGEEAHAARQENPAAKPN